LAVHPVWDNGWLIAATAKGTILAFRAIDGHLVWQRELAWAAHALPALAADRVYVPTEDSRVVALRVDTGATIWERRLGGAPSERGYNAKDGAPAGDVQTKGEIAAPPHFVTGAEGTLPGLVVITRDIATGASAMFVARSVEPALQPFTQLPNPIASPPALPP